MTTFPAAYPVHGIDVSKWQDPANDGAIMDGLAFVGIRACYGTTPDTAYAAHEANARAHGAVVLAYCFGRYADGSQQAKALVNAAPHADLYVLDMEADGTNQAMTASQASAFFAAIRSLTPKKAGLYHSESGFPTGLGQQFNWVAHWGTTTPPKVPWAIWQFQGSPLDSDVFNGTLDQLKAMAGVDQPAYPASLGPKPKDATGYISITGGNFYRWQDPTHKQAYSGRRFSAWVRTMGLLQNGARLSGYEVLSGGYKTWYVFSGPNVKYHAVP